LTDLLLGKISGVNDCQCVFDDVVEGIVTQNLQSFQCCVILHPFWSMFVIALIPALIVYIISYVISRFNDDIYILQDISPNRKDGGEYKMKIDKKRNMLVLVSKPSYEDKKEWDIKEIKAFYIHPTLFGFDLNSRTYYFGTLQGLKIKAEIEKLFEKYKKNMASKK